MFHILIADPKWIMIFIDFHRCIKHVFIIVEGIVWHANHVAEHYILTVGEATSVRSIPTATKQVIHLLLIC